MRKIEQRLRERIKTLEQEKKDLEIERDKFRAHFARRFRWWIELLGKGQTPQISKLIESDAQELYNLSWWHW